MKKILFPALLLLLSLGIASLGTGEETKTPSCQQTLQDNCTRCHGLKKICNKLAQDKVDWRMVVTTMGERGKLGRDAQDAVFTCLTTSTDLKKTACDK